MQAGLSRIGRRGTDDGRPKEKTMTVAIKDERNGEITTGKCETGKVGDVVTVTLRDENGVPMTAIGEIMDVLED